MKSYKEQMDGLRFSPEQKRQMVEDLLSARSGAPRPRRRGGRMLAVGLAAALVLAVGAAGASGALPTASEVLGGIFGGSRPRQRSSMPSACPSAPRTPTPG